MFAGAAREAVFSKPEVIRRVNADFVPVALKAGLVNNPPTGAEGELYREIGRSKLAPQGICVVNSAGKVLDWVLMFDDDQSVLAFFDHCKERFVRYPDARQSIAAERYMRFPSAQIETVADSGKVTPIDERHPPGTRCPGQERLELGTVVARVFGRALGADGMPASDVLRQEHYVEDHFHVTVAMQDALAQACALAGSKRFPIADEFARLLVSHAYLGQLDVNPVAAPGGAGSLKRCEFWGQRVDAGASGLARIRVEGKSEATGTSRGGTANDGRRWQHEVKLEWEGLIETSGNRITRLLVLARGSEKLNWGNMLADANDLSDVARLPGGHPIDLACEVRYGILGEPIPAEEASPAPLGAQVPDEARRQLIEVFGPPFQVFRARVQDELKLSDAEKQKLESHLEETVHDAMQFFQKLEGLTPEERDKELQAYRQKAHAKLASFLKDTLSADQLKRLRQLELQQEGPFALGQPDVMAEMKLSDAQRMQFMGLVQEMQKKIEPLIKEAQSKGNHEEIRPKAMKLRKEYAAKIEAVLSPAQREKWQEMLGQPFEFGE